MKRAHIALLACAAALPITTTYADTFGTGANTFAIDFVTIGNPGNGDDRAFDNTVNTTDPNDDEFASPYGGVAYSYRMGVYEVSQDLIDKATAVGMSNVTAGAWTGSRPATDMTWYEAAAFVNWLNTSTGHQAAYKLTYSGEWTMSLWTSGEAWQLGGQNLFRHKDAYYFLPSEDEWYKAAYHKNDGATANYWDFPTGSNTRPTWVASGTAAGTAVLATSSPAPVNSAGGLGPYGTMGQSGNAYEWIESAVDGLNNSPSEIRSIRGGIWTLDDYYCRASYRVDTIGPQASYPEFGLRVAAVIPEPSSALLLAASGFTLLLQRRARP
jgi:hypothetical protein